MVRLVFGGCFGYFLAVCFVFLFSVEDVDLVHFDVELLLLLLTLICPLLSFNDNLRIELIVLASIKALRMKTVQRLFFPRSVIGGRLLRVQIALEVG
jgi:hypothetical protein